MHIRWQLRIVFEISQTLGIFLNLFDENCNLLKVCSVKLALCTTGNLFMAEQIRQIKWVLAKMKPQLDDHYKL